MSRRAATGGPQGSFGEITFCEGKWSIACEPHVRAKLRRVFPQVNQRAGDVISLSDSDENCRDLLWFTARYPMRIPSIKWMKQRAAGHVTSEVLVHELLSRRRPPQDFQLAKPPRAYQSEAATLAMIKAGLLVADAPGLGKTITAICAMARQQYLPVLVVTLSHLQTQWQDKVHEFAPELTTHILKTGRPYDLLPKRRRGASGQSALFADAGENERRMPDVIICNYHKLHGWAETLRGLVRYAVFDEGQELRHPDSNKYAAAKHIASGAALRMALSATPIYNLGNEFFNVIEILVPGALGTYEEFCREWCADDGRVKDTKAFGVYLRREGLMLRRTRKDVGRELPPCPRIPHTIGSDRSALDRIKGSAVELARIILANQSTTRGERFLANQEFNILMRQATGIAKAPYVADFVKLLLDSEEKVILFGWHREVYSIWMEQLAEFKPRLFTGSESAKQKDDAKIAFMRGDCRVLIMSLRAGAGADGLQEVCKAGVFGELDWSPGVHEQCEARYWRDGQDEASISYFLIAEDGSDPVIAEVLGIKRSQIEGVRDPDAELIESLETDAGSIKRLAQSYLERLGLASGDNAKGHARESLKATAEEAVA